jgi:hypothetical protein
MPDKPFALSIVSPQPPAEGDYDAICATMMQSARGRWFLEEYARRNRSADTSQVLTAIERIESVIRSELGQQPYQSFRNDLLEMAKAITLTRAEVAAIRPESQGPGEDAAPGAPSAQASPLLAAAERIADVAWTMRERGFDPRTCEQIEGLASSILATPSLRNTDDRRTHQLSEVLGYLERRINLMLEAVSPAGRVEQEKGAEAASGAPEIIPPVLDEPRDVRQLRDDRAAPMSGQDAPTAGMPTESELALDAVAAPGTASAEPSEVPPAPSAMETTVDAAIPADETEASAPPAPQPSLTIPMSEVEPADFLLEPMLLPVSSGSPAPALIAAAAPLPDVTMEPDEELFVPAQQGEAEPLAVATAPPAAKPVLRPTGSDSLAALRAMSNAERIALFT